MKKTLAVLGCLFLWGTSVCAQTTTPTPPPKAYFDVGPLSLWVPFQVSKAVGLYDFINKQTLAGGETPVALLYDRAWIDAGVVTSTQGQGTFIAGGHIVLTHKVAEYTGLDGLEIGGWGGRDFQANVWRAGVKASYPFQLW